MSENNETALIADAIAKTEARTFTESEMVACDTCIRVNPPTRATCLYCGADLGTAEKTLREQATASPAPANSDKGYQIVLTPTPGTAIEEAAVAAAAALLDLNVPELSAIISAGQPLPLASAATPEHAATLDEKLSALGFSIITVADEDLRLESPIRRIRSIERSDDSFNGVPVGGGASVSVPWTDIVLIVAGRLLVNRVEVEERQRRGRKQMVGTRELFADESVLDVYAKFDEPGWRIVGSNFDFSCLGSAKTITAFANFKALVELLRGRAANAELDDSYVRLRAALSSVWPIEPQTRRGEWRRSGAGKVDMATVTTTDNEAQFTRYSRLRRCLRLRKLESDT